eukprot:1159813-Pelagomonas_calceolata.AAC.29
MAFGATPSFLHHVRMQERSVYQAWREQTIKTLELVASCKGQGNMRPLGQGLVKVKGLETPYVQLSNDFIKLSRPDDRVRVEVHRQGAYRAGSPIFHESSIVEGPYEKLLKRGLRWRYFYSTCADK